MKSSLALVAALLPLPAAAADLVFVTLDMPDRVVEGRSFSFTVTARNDGLDTSGDVGVVVRASTDATFDVGDTYVCSRTLVNGLANGRSSTTTQTCTWPVGVTGTWWFAGRLDGPLLSELDFSDNDATKRLTVVPGNAPDLVGELRNLGNQVRAGETYAPHLRADNDGDSAAVATIARLYLSADAALGGDTLLCEVAVPAIPAHDRADVDFAGCTIPSWTTLRSGHLILWTDATFQVSEIDEANNVATYPITILPPLPDLRFTAFSGPATVLSGSAFAVDTTLANSGFLDVPSTVIAVRASRDRVYDETDALVCTATVAGPIAGGAATARLTGCTVPPAAGSGPMYLVGRVDPGNTLEERDEANNDTSTAITVRPRLPDLRLAAFTPPQTASPGDVVTVDYTLANDGDADVVNTTLHVRFSADPTYDDADALMCGGAIAGPAAGATRTGSLTGCAVPPRAPLGVGYVVGRVDANGATAESDETDNDAFAELGVQAAPDLRPDWVVTAVSPWGDKHPALWLNASVGVRNAGLAAAPASSWTLYLSDDATLDDGDRALCSSPSVPALAAGASTTMNGVGCALPRHIRLGTWWALVKVDPSDAVSEPNEADNVGGGSFEVVPRAGDTGLDTGGGDSGGHTDVIDTGLGHTDVDPTDTDVDVPDTDPVDGERMHAPARWFCATGGGAPGALWTVGLLLLAVRRRR